MSTTTRSPYSQPALVGGLVTGLLSALPIINAGNICCCLWVVSGGLVAAYVFQQNQASPITPADGALVGLFAGLIGAFVYLAVSIPVSIVIAPFERAVMDRLAELADTMPPNFREYMGGVNRSIGLVLGFIAMLFAGALFSTLGGLLGAAIFRRQPPAAIDTSAIPPSA